MNFISKSFISTAFIFYLAMPVWSQELMIYPAKGQSNDQMEKDKYECYTWAKGQTGFDPMQMPTATSAPPSQQKKSVGGSTLRGGVVGGAGGAIIGGIAGGSSGARSINNAVLAILPDLLADERLQILHLTGALDYPGASDR